MRIISPGIKDLVDPLFTGSCKRCKCVMEAKRSEFESVTYDHREHTELAQANCMECKNPTWFYPKHKDSSNV